VTARTSCWTSCARWRTSDDVSALARYVCRQRFCFSGASELPPRDSSPALLASATCARRLAFAAWRSLRGTVGAAVGSLCPSPICGPRAASWPVARRSARPADRSAGVCLATGGALPCAGSTSPLDCAKAIWIRAMLAGRRIFLIWTFLKLEKPTTWVWGYCQLSPPVSTNPAGDAWRPAHAQVIATRRRACLSGRRGPSR
jgi:hypothetical protein